MTHEIIPDDIELPEGELNSRIQLLGRDERTSKQTGDSLLQAAGTLEGYFQQEGVGDQGHALLMMTDALKILKPQEKVILPAASQG